MKRKEKLFLYATVVCIIGIIENMIGSWAVTKTGIPLYLDSIGTIFSAAAAGYLPGMITGLVTNLVKTAEDSSSVYYAYINILIAIATASAVNKGAFKKVFPTIRIIIMLSIIGSFFGSIVTWRVFGFELDGINVPFIRWLYESGYIGTRISLIASNFIKELSDKTVSSLLLVLFIAWKNFSSRKWNTPRFCLYTDIEELYPEEHCVEDVKSKPSFFRIPKLNLQTKVAVVIGIEMIAITVTATAICTKLYKDSSLADYMNIGTGAAKAAATEIIPEKVQSWLEHSENDDSYAHTKEHLTFIRDSFPNVEYVYVYAIEEDGCHVVFDLDTEEVEGSEPGTIIPFDESFSPYIDDLLAGRHIDPIITNDTYGWLLTAYEPVYDLNGKCVCYAAADVSMAVIRDVVSSFIAKVMTLFFGFFIMVMAFTLFAFKNAVVDPIDAMSDAAKKFSLGNSYERKESLKRFTNLDINTGDEIENLHDTFAATAKECLDYADKIKEQSESLAKTQDGLITVLADVVESRDKCTGDHVRKTAAYTKAIMDQMVREGIYKEYLTDEYMSKVIASAPLHDVGKIKIPDAILNKPGKLTDEEFEIMKSHTTAGNDIIEKAMDIIPDPEYLSETKNMAAHHHEKWNGHGYPDGLKEDEIPLSARILAVADVFDALTSKRSYKDGFPCERAFAIIQEESGTHFDPLVVKAFMDTKDVAEKIAASTPEELSDWTWTKE